jgi:tripartite-type tricarboxylate transporter receptor subunit TctC
LTPLALLVALGGVYGTSQAAQDWPTRPVKIVSPFAPGGGSDTMARLLADELSRSLGQQFFVENRPGASGLIGSAAVANSPPDGYTFLMGSVGTHVIAPATNSHAGFDPIKDFTHIAYLGGPPNVIVVHPSLGVKSLAELTALLKTRTDPMPFVSPGPGTIGHLFAELWAAKAGVKLTHIAYKGSGQAMNDLVAGHVKLGSITWTGALGQIRGGSVIPLAVSASRRMPEFPQVPTMKDLGYPDLVATTWFGIVGPAGVPKPIVTRLHDAIARALQAPELRKRMETDGIDAEPMSAEAFTRYNEAELAKWGPIAREALGQPAAK